MWSRLLREPLVHFVAIGLLLFAVDRWRQATPRERAAPVAAAARDPIVVDAELRRWLADGIARARGGTPPDAAELDQAVSRWIDEEVLYREGLERGLDKDDPAVRKRIADKMAFVLEKQIAVPPPSEAELRAWFDRERERFARPERVDFTHVFVADGDEGRARQLLARLEAGDDPELLGDRFSGGQHYRGRKPADLAASFGPEFARDLDRQPLGRWQLRRSRHGLHLVRVDKVEAGSAADFAAARLDVAKEWTDARRAEQLAARVRALRARWQVVTP